MAKHPGTEYRVFKVGDIVSVLKDRSEPHTDHYINIEIIEVRDVSRQIKATGHPQSLHLKGYDNWISGWWFDPASICLWSKNK